MKTNYINGTRTPEVIAEELKRYGKLEGIVSAANSDIEFKYYTTPQFGKTAPAMEVTYFKGSPISTRKLSLEALNYLLPNKAKDPNTNFEFGGF